MSQNDEPRIKLTAVLSGVGLMVVGSIIVLGVAAEIEDPKDIDTILLVLLIFLSGYTAAWVAPGAEKKNAACVSAVLGLFFVWAIWSIPQLRQYPAGGVLAVILIMLIVFAGGLVMAWVRKKFGGSKVIAENVGDE